MTGLATSSFKALRIFELSQDLSFDTGTLSEGTKRWRKHGGTQDLADEDYSFPEK
jgi:hypothetical protein